MRIQPNAHFSSITDISSEYLRSHNIHAVILDIDNTIVVNGGYNIEPSIKKWLSDLSIPAFFLSNGKDKRVRQFADMFDAEYISEAKKPLPSGFRRIARRLNISDLSKITVIGDQLFSDILGGNLAGCYTIKVPPLNPKFDPFLVKIRRSFEKWL